MKPLGVGQAEAAQKLGVLLNRLNEIVLGKRGITADTARRFMFSTLIRRRRYASRLSYRQLGAYYVPQSPRSAGTLLVRTAGNPRTALASLTKVARDLDPDLPLFRAQTMEEQIHRTVNLRRAVVSLLGVLGVLTLLLASVGIYGVAAHSVSIANARGRHPHVAWRARRTSCG